MKDTRMSQIEFRCLRIALTFSTIEVQKGPTPRLRRDALKGPGLHSGQFARRNDRVESGDMAGGVSATAQDKARR